MDHSLHIVEDLLAFVEVVESGGFTAASRRTGIPKSRLSRRVTALESRLGVALLHRDARRFGLTEIGEQIYAHGLIARTETRQAVALAHESQDIPNGSLRVACPSAMANSLVGHLALKFSRMYPRVVLSLQTTDGRHRVTDDAADLLIYPSTQALLDSSRVARKLADIPYILVAKPSLVSTLGDPQTPADLSNCPAIGWNFTPQLNRWTLRGPEGALVDLDLDVRFASDNLYLNRDAALAGAGVALLPRVLSNDCLRKGELQQVLPLWQPPTVSIYALYPSRRHLTLAGRRFLDLLTQGIADAVVQEPLS